jgi:hypothetical protein
MRFCFVKRFKRTYKQHDRKILCGLIPSDQFADLISGQPGHVNVGEYNVGFQVCESCGRGVAVANRNDVDPFVGKRKIDNLLVRYRIVSEQ